MKIEELLEQANKHSNDAFMDAMQQGLNRAEALTYWQYISSKLYVLLSALHDVDDNMQPVMLNGLKQAIDEQKKELKQFIKKED